MREDTRRPPHDRGPAELRPLLAALAKDWAPERHIFECFRSHEVAEHKPHGRDRIIDQVRRICDVAEVPQVIAHAMRGPLATLTAERELAGHLIAATLGHEDERTTMHAYAAPGSAQARQRLGPCTAGSWS